MVQWHIYIHIHCHFVVRTTIYLPNEQLNWLTLYMCTAWNNKMCDCYHRVNAIMELFLCRQFGPKINCLSTMHIYIYTYIHVDVYSSHLEVSLDGIQSVLAWSSASISIYHAGSHRGYDIAISDNSTHHDDTRINSLHVCVSPDVPIAHCCGGGYGPIQGHSVLVEH